MDSRINTAAIPLMNQSDIQMDHILETMDASNLTTPSDPIPITTPPVLSPTASTSMHLDQEASHYDVNERDDALQSFHPIERQVRRNFASNTQGMNDMILRDHLTHPAPSVNAMRGGRNKNRNVRGRGGRGARGRTGRRRRCFRRAKTKAEHLEDFLSQTGTIMASSSG
eukprot:644206_1